jgi:ketosteroid isomerase-like protein
MRLGGLILLAALASSPVFAKDDPPWTKDPVVAEALSAIDRIHEAILAHDVDSFASLLASDLVVNNPVNTVTHRAEVLDRFRNDRISYSVYEQKIEFAGVRGDGVVVMGEEIVKPIGNAPHAGKTVRRRFTDIWRKEDGVWRLSVRQATIISIE